MQGLRCSIDRGEHVEQAALRTRRRRQCDVREAYLTLVLLWDQSGVDASRREGSAGVVLGALMKVGREMGIHLELITTPVRARRVRRKPQTCFIDGKSRACS